MKKTVRNIHLWLSVPFGLIIMLTCFSGAMLVFEKEVTQWLRPEVFHVDPQGRQPLPMDEVVRRVSATLPEDGVAGVTVYPEGEQVWKVSLTKPSRASVYVDPYTGEVTGSAERLPFSVPCSVCTAGCWTVVRRATGCSGARLWWESVRCCLSSCSSPVSLSGGPVHGRR